MTDWHHRIEHVNGIRIHSVEAGEGPLVLLVHGFPESWYSYRHQLPALAEAGYRAVAIDVRGYGRSSAPDAVEAYRMLAHVADNVGLVGGARRETGRRGRPRLGRADRLELGADCAPTSSAPSPDCRCRSPRPATPGRRCLPGHGRRRGVLHRVLPASPGGPRPSSRRDVRRWLLGFYFTASGDAPPPIRAARSRRSRTARRCASGSPTRHRCRRG